MLKALAHSGFILASPSARTVVGAVPFGIAERILFVVGRSTVETLYALIAHITETRAGATITIPIFSSVAVISIAVDRSDHAGTNFYSVLND